VSWGAFAGALLAMVVVFALSRAKDTSSEQMLLAGVAVNFFFSSMIVLLQYISSPHDTVQILRWTMGGVQNAIAPDNVRLGLIVLPTVVFFWFFSRELNVIVTGRNRAQSLGINVDRLRTLLFILTSLLVGAIVAVTGPIGFVGLMIPHIARRLIGASHQRLIPVTFLLGSAFLALCDTLGRCLFFPSELPVGIITSLLGGPFFLCLLLRSEKRLG
jgi:iron complex transport system permease protein